MPILRVVHDAAEKVLPFLPGGTLRDILRDHDLPVPSACAGSGICGGCRVRLQGGFVHAPTAVELSRLTESELSAGIRLACQVHPAVDIQVVLDAPPLTGSTLDWTSLPLPTQPLERVRPRAAGPLGLAVDLGTTHVRVAMCDLASGHTLARRVALNPQAAYGADVLARLDVARSAEHACQLAASVTGAIGSGLRTVLEDVAAEPARVARVSVVGNTAMLLLLCGKSPESLLDPARWMAVTDWDPPATGAWLDEWGIPADARLTVVPPLAGFVGSDLLASLVGVRLCESLGPALLVDFGTNSEVALWDGHRLLVTSAAGGPAFEACGISCGLPQGPGAAYRVAPRPGRRGEFTLTVRGGEPARGLNGAGLVDAVACLLESGQLFRGGQFTSGVPREGLILQASPYPIVINRRDVDTFQRAKAAIAAAIDLLLERGALRWKDLRRVCVCGAFGEGLRLSSATAVGLLPPVDAGAVDFHGQAALAGAECMLQDSHESCVETCRRHAAVVDLAGEPRYDERFVANLRLSPMS